MPHHVLMVASEAAPFVKTGGLADVLGALPLALHSLGEDVAVVLPRYRNADAATGERLWTGHPVWLGGVCYPVDIWRASRSGVPYYLVDCPPLYAREGLYTDAAGRDFPDNHIRFAVLCRAAIALARHLVRPRIFHCHDWQASLVAVYLRTLLAGDPTLMTSKILLTIHNIGYQGLFEPAILPEIGLDATLFHINALEFYGRVNLLKGGIVFSDAINTVSKTYAAEIQTPEYGCGLDGVLRARAGRLYGILNGADYTEWNPETDPFIAARYSASDLSGKRLCKRDLIALVGLPDDAIERPLVGIVSRFVGQKGFDLLEEVAAELLQMDLSLVALGTGEPRYEQLFRDLAAACPSKVAVRIAYDNVLAHKIEAGADIFLMPSRYEPCGLNQMYSLRYGTVPVVRATGGLDDTIDESTGFKFKEYTGPALLRALREAVAAWHDPGRWHSLIQNGMRRDFSWLASAAEYQALYRTLEG
ncbi:MAG: glycogen synthase GlgA [Bryobacterales bacterium]|nr:glycogen synthase GlgA [Bryobacteraceae bacterium]MDW8353619.1 glycogen synthase GlgA [Bryobacterales bacterium]